MNAIAWLATMPIPVLIVVKSTLLGGIGWMITRVLRNARPIARYSVWLGVIVAILLLPILTTATAVEWPVVVAPIAPASAQQATMQVGDIFVPVVVASRPENESTAVPVASFESNLVNAATFAWLGVALLFVLRLFVNQRTLRSIVQRSRPLDREEWHRAIRHAVRHVGLGAAPRVCSSDEVDVPFTCNVRHPTIILPASAVDWSESLRHAVLTHEMAHVKRHDLLGHLAASFACSIYWFNPFVWLAGRQLRIEGELASDAVVLESGMTSGEYAQHLLDMVTGIRRGAPHAALAMARPGEFEGRLIAILGHTRRNHAHQHLQQRSAFGFSALCTLSIAMLVPVTRDPDVVLPSVALPTPVLVGETPRATSPKTSHVAPHVVRSAHLSSDATRALLRAGSAGMINPMQELLRNADALGFNGMQADSIATLNRAYLVGLYRIWRPVMQRARRASTTDLAMPEIDAGDATRRSVDLLRALAKSSNALLTADQRARLPAPLDRNLDERVLSELRQRATQDANVIFELPRRGGARMGGAGDGWR